MTMEEEKARAKRIQEMVDDLNSKNERRVIGALKMIPHEGGPEMIEPMFQILQDGPSKEVRILLEKSLYNLKDPAAIDPMMDILRNEKKSDMHQIVLNALWQSGLDVSNELELLVTTALKGNFMTAVEAVTIIEHLEFKDDAALTAAISRMDKAVEIKDEKQELMVSMRQLLLEKLLGEG